MKLTSIPFLLAAAGALAPTDAQDLVFDDVAVATDTLDLGFGRAAAMVDLDRDGRLDLVCADAAEPNRFFRQEADGTFEDAATRWGVGIRAEYDWGVLAADFDNDGDDDLYFGNGGFAETRFPGRAFPNQVLRNDIAVTGLLVDVSASSGDGIHMQPTFGVTALDYDRDGLLDIFCSDRNRTCALLRGDGMMGFDDVSGAAGIVHSGNWRHTGSADYDADGWPDVGVGGEVINLLYHNEADGTFSERAKTAGVDDPLDNFGMVFQDYDNDGLQDIYVAKYVVNSTEPSPVYLNNGDGTFRNVSPGTGMGQHTDMGHESGDLDADGFPELLMGTGAPNFSDEDRLYRVTPDGAGGLTIVDVSTSSGFDSAGPSRQHGQALGDFDRDGDVDVYCNNGGPSWFASTAETNNLWQNRGNANAWAAFELEGVYSNRTGVGLLAKATTDTGREVYRTIQVGRGFSNTPDHAVHVGIGDDTGIERLELRWPSGIVQSVDAPAMEAYTAVIETGALLRGTPALGGTFSFDVAGRPGDVVQLGFSLGTGTTELDGQNGPLLLAPPYLLLPAVPLDASGRLTLPITLPDAPALDGTTVHAQAWVHDAGGGGTLSQLHSFTL